MSGTSSDDDRRSGAAAPRELGDESGIIVFGGGGRGCSLGGCLFWILISVTLSVGLTVLVNIIAWLFSGSPTGVPVIDV